MASRIVASYAWNATETHRMARKIRRHILPTKDFQPKAPADYDHRFCLFDRYMMEKAQAVGLVGLKSTGKSSTLLQFLRGRPNPFYLKLMDGNLYDAMYDKMKTAVFRLPLLSDHLLWDAAKTSEDIAIKVFELVREQSYFGGGTKAAKALYSKALGGAVCYYGGICQHCKDDHNFMANFDKFLGSQPLHPNAKCGVQVPI